MTKLTKEAAKELLTNRKVYVNGKSREIQEKLFECGFEWNNGKVLQDKDAPFLLIGSDKIGSADSMDWYSGHSFKEITAEEILSIEIEEGFKDGDFVYGGVFDRVAIYHSTNYTDGIVYHACTDERKGCLIEVPSKNGIGLTRDYKGATPEQRQLLIDELAKVDKQWNAEKKCIEDLPKKPKELKPFDRVLVRDEVTEEWRCNFFSQKRGGDYNFSCCGGDWKQCIPYQGNDHLLGTTNNPKQ